jgi:4-amino-4-deoxy-L-arabinose transferase-like glycosyltransferase
MSRPDRIALLLSLLAILVTYLVTDRIFEGIPHLEDEVAYVWQAEAIAGGKIAVPSPPQPKSFLVPFVVDYDGLRFGKYPPGWPLVLAIGVKLGLRFLVNPLLAGLGVWLTYLLGKRVFGEVVGLLAAGLTLTSPFFLIN